MLLLLLGGLATAADSTAKVRNSPIADAAQRRDGASVQSLLSRAESDVNAVQADGMTALHWAAYHSDLKMAESLLAADAQVNAKNRYGVSPLTLACQNGNTGLVKLLLEAGADANDSLPGGETVLMTAARTGVLGPVRLLLSHGAKVGAKERNGQTALMWAAAEGHGEVVDALVEAGADINASLRSGFNALFFAVREGRIDVVSRLLHAGADVNEAMQPERSSGNRPKAGTSPLMLAVENGHFELALRLLEAGADPNDRRRGFAPLHAMTWVRKPLGGDGDPAPIGSGGVTSLEFVRALVEHGADVNLRHGKANAGDSRLNPTDATAFLLAANTEDLPLMKLLLELGADPTLTNKDHCTPLLAAAGVDALGSGHEPAGTEEEALEVVNFLLELGADINAVDDLGNSVMHGAAFKEWTRLVRFLADQGADIEVWNRKNKRGWTPLLIAEGYRPGNFRLSPATIDAISEVMREAGVEPLLSSSAKTEQD